MPYEWAMSCQLQCSADWHIHVASITFSEITHMMQPAIGRGKFAKAWHDAYQEAQHRAAAGHFADEGHNYDTGQEQPDGFNQALCAMRNWWQRQLLQQAFE